MKHDLAAGLLPLSRPIDAAADRGQFCLHLILEVSDTGDPIIAGMDPANVISGTRFGADTVGCLAIGINLAAGPVLLIGHVPLDAIARAFSQGALSPAHKQADTPLSLKCGRSELRLYPDGRVRILGDDVSIEALGRMSLKGAVVELN